MERIEDIKSRIGGRVYWTDDITEDDFWYLIDKLEEQEKEIYILKTDKEYFQNKIKGLEERLGKEPSISDGVDIGTLSDEEFDKLLKNL